MDMKQILQAMDSVKTSAPIEDTNDIKKFMSIVTEGATPHKVALPVQMAMQHYATPVANELTKKTSRPSLLKQYMAEASAEQEQVHYAKKAEINQYAQYIAYKVMGESLDGHSMGYDPGAGPGMGQYEESAENPQDVVTVDIPLLIRLLEYAREDAQTDMDLHNVADMLIKLSATGEVLTMDNYDQIVGDHQLIGPPEED
jgi:hypothetical protein